MQEHGMECEMEVMERKLNRSTVVGLIDTQNIPVTEYE